MEEKEDKKTKTNKKDLVITIILGIVFVGVIYFDIGLVQLTYEILNHDNNHECVGCQDLVNDSQNSDSDEWYDWR